MLRALAKSNAALRVASCSLAALFAMAPALSEAQQGGQPAAPAAGPEPSQPPSGVQPGTAAAPQPQQAAQTVTFAREELRKLLMPIALYPDPLLAQLLPASAYPVEIVQAERWLAANQALVAKNDFSGIDKQDWDPAVKALARFPEVMQKMSADLAWTTDLGDAIVNQPQDVAAVIQELRAEAEKSGALVTTAQQTVNRVASTTPQGEQSVITIQPTDPSTIYVPAYDPNAVYGETSIVAPLLTFGTGIALGALATGAYWNWGTGAIYPPVWRGYPGWRPPYPGWRPGAPINNGNINIGNNVNVGAGNRPWRPNADYRPGQGSKPGIGNRPGGPGRPGGVGGPGRPGGIGGPGGVGGPGRPGGVGGPGRPGGVGGPGRPGGAGGPGQRPGAGARPGGARPGGARPATRPAGRPGGAVRPSRPAGPSSGGAYGGARPGGFHGGARPGGYHGGGMRAGGYHGGGGGHRGGHRGGGFHGGGGGHRGGHRGGGGGRRRSDLRLKHDIVLLGRLSDGLGYYRFVYNGGHIAYVGVIAQEVQAVAPEAVTRGADGYFRVSYDLLGLPFETYRQWVATGAHLPSVT